MKDKKRNIVLLIRALPLGGAEKQCLLLARVLLSEYNVVLVVQKDNPLEQRYLDFIAQYGIELKILKGSFLSRIIQFRKFLKEFKCDILFSYLTLDNLLSAFSTIGLKIFVVAGIRNCKLPYSKYITLKYLQKFFFNKLLYNNYSGKDELILKGFNSTKSIVIHNCMDKINLFFTRPKKEKLNILTVGRFVKQKDYHTAIKTIKYLQKELGQENNISYTIVGFGDLKDEIKKYIEKYDVKNTNLVVSPSDLELYYKEADIYLGTSIFEGVPNTIMEAVNYSLPVVSTKVGDVEFLVKHGNSGYLTNVYDYKTLAQYLNQLVLDYEKRIIFGKKGNSLLATNFSEEKFKMSYLELIEKN